MVADLVRLDVNLLLLVWVENLVDLRAQRREVGHFQDLVQSAREGVRNPVAEIDGCSVLVYQHLALLQSDVASHCMKKAGFALWSWRALDIRCPPPVTIVPKRRLMRRSGNDGVEVSRFGRSH